MGVLTDRICSLSENSEAVGVLKPDMAEGEQKVEVGGMRFEGGDRMFRKMIVCIHLIVVYAFSLSRLQPTPH
jgi:hypothetical protein